MINRALHAITNRVGGFNTPSLLTDARYKPYTETAASKQLRALLGLDRAIDDYHVFAALAAVEAYPAIFEALNDRVRSYALSDYAVPAPIYGGGVPVADAKGAPRCHLVGMEAPVPQGFSLAYIDTKFGVLQYGARRDVIPVDYVSSTVYPTWPHDFGFNGGIQMTWGAGAVFTVRAYPSHFPYEVLADKLTTSDAKTEFLQRQQLVDHFHLAPTAMNKVAVAVLALALSNPAAYA